MDIDDEIAGDIADLFIPEYLADKVKKIIEGTDADKQDFQEALKPYKIVKLEDTIKAKKYIAQSKQIIKSLEEEIEHLKAIMNSCDSCQWESGENMKLKM
ncbi:MAG: hypothetical protein CMO44_13450 [Verrucomicrobiales bacterium]|nr:hypothetical protein [Verrucomicrobiales bacterium]